MVSMPQAQTNPAAVLSETQFSPVLTESELRFLAQRSPLLFLLSTPTQQTPSWPSTVVNLICG
jgi:hypothetical protein